MWWLWFLFMIILPVQAVNVWKDEVKPTLIEAQKPEHLMILGGGVASAWLTSPYDGKVRHFRNDDGNLLIGKEESKLIDRYTYGPLQVVVSASLLVADTKEGVRLSKALIFTSLSHLTLSRLIHRPRPNRGDHFSMPSGHTSSMFAFAGTLAGSYGLKVAIPAYTAATLTALSRIKEDDHWLSDVVAGMFLGTYWARVVHGEDSPAYTIVPVKIDDGLMVSVMWDF